MWVNKPCIFISEEILSLLLDYECNKLIEVDLAHQLEEIETIVEAGKVEL